MTENPNPRISRGDLEELRWRIQRMRDELAADCAGDPDIEVEWIEMDRRHKAVRARLSERNDWRADLFEGFKMDVEILSKTFKRTLRKLGHRVATDSATVSIYRTRSGRRLMSSD